MNLSTSYYIRFSPDKRWPLPQPGTPDHYQAIIINEAKRLWEKT